MEKCGCQRGRATVVFFCQARENVACQEYAWAFTMERDTGLLMEVDPCRRVLEGASTALSGVILGLPSLPRPETMTGPVLVADVCATICPLRGDNDAHSQPVLAPRVLPRVPGEASPEDPPRRRGDGGAATAL